MKILITGILGSGSSYLAEYIAEFHPEVEIHGIARWHSTATTENIGAIKKKVVIHECDLNDFSAVFSVLKKVKPDRIFHLASHANVRASFNTPLSVLDNNIMSTANLFEAVRMAEIDPIIQHCGTSEVYGQVNASEVPLKENSPFRPASPYAVSKVTQDLLGELYFKNYGLKIIRTRMFTYINPRRADLFATAFAMQVARIELGLQSELLHGNLESIRTIMDVRDASTAYWLAVEHCQPGEAYNIGGTTTKSVGDFLEYLKKKAKVKISTKQDPALFRPTDVTLQIPNTEKFVNATGWKPQYSFEESVDFLLDHCRKVVSKNAGK